VHLLVAPLHAAGGRVESHVAQPQRRRAGSRAGAATQQRRDPRRELAHAEGLGQVVVGAHPQAHDHVRLLVAGGEHEDEHGTCGLHLAADLVAVQSGQHEVQDDEVGGHRPAQRDSGRAVPGDLDPVPVGAQAGGDGIRDGRLVLDEDDGRGAAIIGIGHDGEARPATSGSGRAGVRVL
jgi:hypothetical protein